MSPLVGIIDYRTGNSRSFSYALDRVEVPNRLVVTPRDVEGVTHFVLPGVGAAGVTKAEILCTRPKPAHPKEISRQRPSAAR